MPDDLAAALATLAQTFTVSLLKSGGTPLDGTPQATYELTLVSPGSERGGLTVDVTSTLMQMTDSIVDLSWLTKSVRFVTTGVSDAAADLQVVGGMPISDLLTGLTNGPTGTVGVPGILGAIQGSFQLPMDVTSVATTAVDIDAKFTISDGSGNGTALSNDAVRWQIGTLPTGSGGTISMPAGDALLPVGLTFAPLFLEALAFDGTSFVPPLAQRSLVASVQLRAAGASSGWIDLPAIPLFIPVLAVPTILFCLENASFTSPGVGLIMVPANSPLDSTTIQAALTALGTALAPIQNLSAVLNATLGLLAGNLGTISSVLSSVQSAKLSFSKADGISDLSNIEWKDGWLWSTDTEDEISALIMIGPPGRTAECYNGRYFSGSAEGEMNVNVGPELLVLVPSTHSANPASNPVGDVSVPFAPTGGVWPFSISSFGDEFSSIRFAWH